ncbi:pyridoxal phosphatase [Malassezia equina]|uniref:Pyridoxal phosphatase n=1 Tax=Malassezia equina TaxID=1381935 RepID=A0AAF0ED42_9BASI|nr:pyridoxal phosphatase [Malassezia equina]
MMSQRVPPRPASDRRTTQAELFMVDQRDLAVHSIVLEDPPLDFAPLPEVSSQLVVFDFDWSLADQDTDRWVHEVLSPRLRIEFVQKKPTMQFTDMWYVYASNQSAYLLEELHKEGHSREAIEDALRSMPMHPAMIRGVRTLQTSHPHTDFFLLSNSNEVYIQTILPSKGLTEPPLFKEIVTNPAHWEPNGLLRLSRRISPDGPQHSCRVGCSANMCKGDELDAYRARHASSHYQRIVYVGDGGNDFCPILRLGKNDAAFVRRNRGLSKRILEEGGVQCTVRYWSGAWEVEQLLRLLSAPASAST